MHLQNIENMVYVMNAFYSSSVMLSGILEM